MIFRRQTVRNTMWPLAQVVCLGGVLLLSSCNKSPASPADAPLTPKTETKSLLGHRWDALYIGDAKVGQSHFFGEEKEGQLHLRTTSTMEIKRFGQKVAIHLTYASVETPQGKLLSFSSEMNAGPQTTKVGGVVEGEQISLQTTTVGKTTSSQLDWKPEWRGFFATEASLRRKPMQPGETRTMRALLPVFTQVADVSLRAVRRERTPLLQEERELLRIESSVKIAGNSIDTTLWTDKNGEVLKSYSAGIEQYSYRVSEAVALAASSNESFDLGNFSIVPVKKQLDEPHATRRVVYRMTLSDADPAICFVNDASQQVTSLGKNMAEVIVAPLTPDSAGFSSPNANTPLQDDAPTESDTAPNNLIQSDDPLVMKMAGQVVPEEKNTWAVAQALERYVHEAITAKNFSQAFATAAEVAQSLEGDCTEHAVLLAAFCRARGIPARTAIGLVYYPRANGFAYHMWTEVWIADRWLALDATLGQGGIGAAHIKIAQSNLEGANAYNAFLPVIQILGRLQMEIVSVE